MENDFTTDTEKEGSVLEQTELSAAADLLKKTNFSKDNYQDLIDIINKIKQLNKDKNVDIDNDVTGQQNPQKAAAEQQTAAEQPAEVSQVSKKAKPVVFGKTVLPKFAVMTNNGLKLCENYVVQDANKDAASYILDNGKDKIELPQKTLESLLLPNKEQEQAIETEKASGVAIIEGETKIPEFALITQHGLKTFKDCVMTKYSAAEDSYTLSNGDQTVVVPGKTFTELTQPEKFERPQFAENTPAYQKMLKTQYDDFFQQRENTANNFRHNLSVYCRKEANTPIEALKIAKELVNRMPEEERIKTQRLLKQMDREEKGVNQLVVAMYHEAVKQVPLNEEHIKMHQPENALFRRSYDTISTDGQKVDKDSQLSIGDTVKNVELNCKDIFGKGKDTLVTDLKVISSSKETNKITVMDGKNSFYELPRDTFLKNYEQSQERQAKEVKKTMQQHHSMSIDIER